MALLVAVFFMFISWLACFKHPKTLLTLHAVKSEMALASSFVFLSILLHFHFEILENGAFGRCFFHISSFYLGYEYLSNVCAVIFLIKFKLLC